MIAGTPCLDFANTVTGLRGTDKEAEHLHGYGDLLSWAAQAALLTPDRARELQQTAGQSSARPAQVLARSVALREAIYAIFSALAAKEKAPAAALDLLNDEVVEAMTNARIVRKSGGFDWELPADACGLFLPLHAIARDAAELLTSRHLKEVRECSLETCGWLFLDETRNHSRQWCEMSVCGNRAKQTRFRNRSARAAALLSRRKDRRPRK